MKKDDRVNHTSGLDNEDEPAGKRRLLSFRQGLLIIGIVFLVCAALVVKKYWPLWEQELLPEQFIARETPDQYDSSLFCNRAPQGDCDPQDASKASEGSEAPIGSETPVPSETESAPGKVVPAATPIVQVDDWNYVDKDIEIRVTPESADGVKFFVAEIKLRDISFFRTALAEDKFGNYREDTSSMAKRKGAILAMNGDYCGFAGRGIIIRDGKLYRDKPVQEMAALFSDGHMEVMAEKGVDADELLARGALHTWSFGPWLIKDGETRTDFSFSNLKRNNPRAGIGMVAPFHYIFIVVDGRSDESRGMKLSEFAKEFEKRGCMEAYNLDGGGSATMYFNYRVLNSPLGTDNERSISDILYIGK